MDGSAQERAGGEEEGCDEEVPGEADGEAGQGEALGLALTAFRHAFIRWGRRKVEVKEAPRPRTTTGGQAGVWPNPSV